MEVSELREATNKEIWTTVRKEGLQLKTNNFLGDSSLLKKKGKREKKRRRGEKEKVGGAAGKRMDAGVEQGCNRSSYVRGEIIREETVGRGTKWGGNKKKGEFHKMKGR